MSETLQQLMCAMLDGELDDAGRQRLGDLLRSDANLRQQYLDFMATQAMIQPHLNREAALTAFTPLRASDPSVADPSARRSLLSLQRPAVRFALAAMLILCFGVIASVVSTLGMRHSETRPALPAVATLTGTIDAVFGPSDLPTEAGSQLSGGFLRLRSGTATIDFYDGAEVTLHGPCEFGVNSESRGFLRSGKITAFVPTQAHGFTVGAPACAVVDLGTRFGMSVEGGDTQVHVLQGRVIVQRDAVQDVPLDIGQALSVTADGQTHRIAFNGSEFAPPATEPIEEAGDLIRNVHATASSSESPIRLPDRAVDGSGLQPVTLEHTSSSNYSVWNSAQGDVVGAWFKVDLGRVYWLREMWLWNYNDAVRGLFRDRGVKTADIYVSDSGIGSPTKNPAEWKLFRAGQNFEMATGKSSYNKPTKLDMQNTPARFVALVVRAHFAPDDDGKNYVAISEIQFFGEPVSGDAKP